MKQYLAYLQHILDHGVQKVDRTGIGVISLFGYQMRFPLSEGFPLLTTKKLHTKSIFYELLWFLRGDTNLSYLKQHGISIWAEWADTYGNLGPVYGKQWRAWQTTEGRMIAQQCELDLGDFVWTGGDCHIYLNHLEQVKLQLTRMPHTLPQLSFKRKPASLFDYDVDDIEIINYQAHPHIKGKVAV